MKEIKEKTSELFSEEKMNRLLGKNKDDKKKDDHGFKDVDDILKPKGKMAELLGIREEKKPEKKDKKDKMKQVEEDNNSFSKKIDKLLEQNKIK